MAGKPEAQQPVRRGRRSRGLASLVLTVIAGLLAVATLVSGFVRTELVDADRFASRATATIIDSPVRDRLAADITDELTATGNEYLLSFRPLIEAAIRESLGTAPARLAVRSAIADLHRTVLSEREDTATALLADIAIIARAGLTEQNPKLGRQIPENLDLHLTTRDLPAGIATPIEQAKSVARPFLPLLLATLLTLLVAVLVAPVRTVAIRRLSLTLAGAGILLIVLTWILQARTLREVPSGLAADLVESMIRGLFKGLRSWAIGLAGTGLIVSAALRPSLGRLDLHRLVGSGWRWLTGPAGSVRAELLRSGFLVGLGVLTLLERDLVLRALVLVAGALLVLVGLERIFGMIRDAMPDPGRDADRPGRRRRLPVKTVLGLAGAGVGAFLLLGGGLFATGTITLPEQDLVKRCNGHEELCDRSLDRVAFAMTHNSMAAVDSPGWMFAQQETGVPGQLEAGIRGLMLDAHFGRQVGNRVRTEMDRGQMNRELMQLFGVDGTAAAERIRNRLVGSGEPGPREVWLCHGVCEVGATSMQETLASIRDFLVTSPGEVLVIIIQDEDVPPAAIADEFTDAGLIDHVWERPLDEGFPALGEMVEQNRRLLVFAENDHDPEVGWYHPAFEYIQETPFHFTAPEQMSCAENRGPTDAPLFLINNWIDTTPTPSPRNARIVNSNPALWDRVEECRQERGRFPNFVAVDFFRQGDLFEVVDRLNEVG